MHHYFLSRLGQLARLLLSLIFVTGLSLPVAGTFLFPSAQSRLAEKREALPAFSGSPDSLRAVLAVLRGGWLERNYPFRAELISLDNLVSVRMLSSTLFSPVVMGGDDWLFLARDRGRDLLQEHRAVSALADSALAATAAEFKSRRVWLAQRGIKYLLIVAPDKTTIYPENLPRAYQAVFGPSYLDQTLTYLGKHATLDILDLRPAVLQAKLDRQVFYRTDTHWNAYGAYAGYLATVARLDKLFPGLKAATLTQYRTQTSIFSGDQAKLLGLDAGMKEAFIQFFPANPPHSIFFQNYRTNPHYVRPAWASSRPEPTLPSAVILHDSYYVEQFLYFPDHFRHGVYVWVEPAQAGEFRFFDKDLIESEHPDIVIEEYAERYFYPPPPNQASHGGQGG